MNNCKRNAYMDFLKGIAIVSVIIGHSLSDIAEGRTLFHLIYSFHMPLLMFISAYIEEQNREKYMAGEWQILLKRACGLLIPYVSWTVLDYVISGQLRKMQIKELLFRLFGYKESGLWFFPVLFGLKILHCLYWRAQKRIRKHNLIKDILLCCLLEIVTAFAALLTKQPYVINMISYMIPYFFAVVIIDNEILQKVLDSELTIAGAFFAYILIFPLFSFYDTNWTTQVIRIGLSLCVIVICLKLRENWEMNRWNEILCLFGENSLAIYVLHGFFMDYTFYFYLIESRTLIAVVSIVSAFIIAGVCVAIARIIGISSWWRKILFGK